jgi:hypothetical protein
VSKPIQAPHKRQDTNANRKGEQKEYSIDHPCVCGVCVCGGEGERERYHMLWKQKI